MTVVKPCLAIVLIPGCEPQYAGSYHWCSLNEHDSKDIHLCYCGISWMADDLVEPTPEMILWRTGNEDALRSVRGKMLG